jgi:two-component system sensor histidine kinase KdpD
MFHASPGVEAESGCTMYVDVHTEPRDLIEDRRSLPAARERIWISYAISLALIGMVSLAGFYAQSHIARTNIAMLYLLTVVVSALRFGRGPAIFSAVSGSLIFGSFFIPPFRPAGFDDIWYLITFVTLLVVGLVISTLASHAREETRKARTRERYTAALYSLSRSLAGAGQLDQILEALGRHIAEIFHQPVAVLLPEGEELVVRFQSDGVTLDEGDRAAAAWSFRHARNSGSRVSFLPLKTWRGVLGVLGIQAGESPHRLSPEQWQLLEGFVSQAASSIERSLLAEEARQAQILQEGNKLQKALLNSISHNLRTPLSAITGALSSVLEDQAVRDTGAERELLETALGESERLNRVVGNLLDMTRLEAGGIGVKLEPADMQDVLGTAFEHLGGATRGREIRVQIEPNLPLVDMDSVLIAQVLVNLLDNALKYSPEDQPVDVRVRSAGGSLEVEVEDRGIGIAAADLERVFERFYRAPRTGAVHGMGLGLSICRRFVEAHGGSIRAASTEHEGTTMIFLLPLAAERSAMEVANGRPGSARFSG